MASWNTLPYDVRHLILTTFSRIIINDYRTILDHCILCKDPDLPFMNPDRVYPAPFCAFRSALPVSHEFFDVLSHIKLHDEPLPQRLKTCQLEIMVHLLDVYEEVRQQPTFYYDNVGMTSLEAARATVGNFWKNFDVFEPESDVIYRLYTLIPEEEHKLFFRKLLPYLQYLSERSTQQSSRTEERRESHGREGSGEPEHEASYTIEKVHDENSLWISKIMEVSGVMPKAQCCVLLREIAASLPGEWLDISCDDYQEPLFLVNIKKKQFYKLGNETGKGVKEDWSNIFN